MRQEDLDRLRSHSVPRPEMIIGGAGVAAKSGQTLRVPSPIDGAQLADLPDAEERDVEAGGFKQSGNGQDKSLHAIDKFINKKTAWIKL